jgi:hypothetical protein
MKKTVAYLLIILGIAMIYIGSTAPKFMLPPVITGIGFFAIAVVYLQEKN